jgi:uracil phosphoribosyltransferase
MTGVAQPDRAAALALPQVRLSRHPLVVHKLTLLRQTVTDVPLFRRLVAELTYLLGYEAMADLPLTPRPIETPLAAMTGARIGVPVAIVPILRAGLGLIDGFLDLLPEAQVWHIGLYRDERTLRPVSYYNKLTTSLAESICLVLDPMLATGGSATGTVEVLKGLGARQIRFVGLVAAPYGVVRLARTHPDVLIHIAALDDHLNEAGYIVPGLGDAGDRLFGTGGPASPPA